MSSNTPHISVVIPVRNGANYLAGTLEGIFQQTYQNFNILVLENSSTDDTVEILRAYENSRLQVFPSTEALSIEANWGRIIDLPLSEYMTILGHDDIFYPDFLQEIVSLIEKEPDASLYITHFHIIDSDGNVIRDCKPMPYKESGEAFMRARQHFQRDSFGTGYVMRSEDYKRVGGLPPFAKLFFSDDFVFYRLADISYKICSPQFLFGYRYHLQSEAYGSGMETLTQASRQFFTELQKTPYAKNSVNMRLAQDYLNKTFTRRYIRILVNLIYSGETAKLPDFYAARRDFLQHFPSTSFSTYNIMARIVEWVTRLHLVYLQKILSRVLYKIVKMARGMKN